MTLRVIGAGVGRTGTLSLRIALNRLGLGPCHHMEEVLHNIPRQVPLWQAAVDGKADWEEVYRGYTSAVDWPTATYFRELNAFYPQAKFVLTVRSAQTWAESFSETIYKALAGRAHAPAAKQPWLTMCAGVIEKAGFGDGLDIAGLAAAFDAHVAAVRTAIPADRLLVFQVTEGWAPLCAFLGVPVPEGDFPRTNDRAEFWELIKAGH
jgi:Sulfotransferase domain